MVNDLAQFKVDAEVIVVNRVTPDIGDVMARRVAITCVEMID